MVELNMPRTFDENCIIFSFITPAQAATGDLSSLPAPTTNSSAPNTLHNKLGGKPMEDSKNTSLALISSTDQMCEHMASFANVLNTFRKELRSGGMTRQEAFSLVMDFHQMFWTKQFFPDSEVGFGMEEF